MTEARIELPPLPEFPVIPERLTDRGLWVGWAQEYARAAVLADRARSAPPDYFSVSTTELGLSVFTRNILLAERLYTVGDIYQFRGGILHIPNMGRKSAAEIDAALVARGWPPVYDGPRAAAIRKEIP